MTLSFFQSALSLASLAWRSFFSFSICLMVKRSPLLALTSPMANVMSLICSSMIRFWRS